MDGVLVGLVSRGGSEDCSKVTFILHDSILIYLLG